MLNALRKNAKRVLWPLTIVIIIGMGGWGAWNAFQRAETVGTKVVGQIWGREVREGELQWERILLSEEAVRVGITVEQQELAAFIASLPFFQQKGRFSPELFQGLLAKLQLPETAFEEQMSTLLKMEKLRNTIRLRALVSPQETADYYALLHDQARAEYLEIERAEYSEPLPLKDEELFAVYQRYQRQFQVPARVEIQYVFIPAEPIAEKAAPGDEEIKVYYDANGDVLMEKDGKIPTLEEARIRIVNRLTEEKTIAELDRMAGEIDEMLAADPRLEPVAEKYSLELKTPEPIALADPIPGLGEAPEINRAAFGMQVCDASYPVILDEGIVFFKLSNKTEAGTLSFEEAKEKLRGLINDDLTDRETRKAAADILEEIRNLMETEKLSFAEAAKKIDRKTVETPPLVRAKAEELGDLSAFLPAAFLTPVGQVSPVFPTEKGYAFLFVTERLPSPPLPEAEKKEWSGRAFQRKSSEVYNDWFRNLIVRSKLSIANPAQGKRQDGPQPQPRTGNL
ncbi:MAG: peptidyl-prolyl cis-trans isomerase [Candidatus Aureabacteria bacterium]|nr:peptidyl-prolyl cis-trans isomerase [Candidatus Auribacterota bacterium]